MTLPLPLFEAIASLLLSCVQGEKGEPGLIMGADGNPLYIGALSGPKVSPS